MLIKKTFYLLALLFSTLTIADELQIEVSSGMELSVSHYKTSNPKNIILWIPTEYGIRGKEAATAKSLSSLGNEVWIVDLHSSYFIPTGRRSYSSIDPKDISDLILKASNNQQHEVILFATGRAAPLALQASRQLQLQTKTRNIVKRAVFFHPNFYAGTTTAGKSIEYLPITFASNLAIHIVQPSLSGKRYQLNTLKKHLETSGSDVTTQILPNISDGFNVRKTDILLEKEQYLKVPNIINKAIKLLSYYNKERTAPYLPKETKNKPITSLKSGLHEYSGDIKATFLNFKDLKNNLHTIKKHKGHVLLINFWASWCPPCVKELPSLNRLKSKINNEDFKILAVNIGEKSATVKSFLKPMNIQFSILTDPKSESVEPWKLLAFPSSFVIDKNGIIRYALFGGIEWDNKDVVKIISDLLRK